MTEDQRNDLYIGIVAVITIGIFLFKGFFTALGFIALLIIIGLIFG